MLETIETLTAMSDWAESVRARGKQIAFVPTMGALHQGHLSLITAARKLADHVVLSIFVNPTQFGPNEDFTKYPRDLPGDLAKAVTAGADLAFTPEVSAMYPEDAQTFVEVGSIARGLCGDRRPHHFRGVATIVCKLFHIVHPHVAIFGEKDFQQLAVIRQMVRDLNMHVTIVGHPTVRDADGLALSSRNAYLSAEERSRALAISQSLSAAHACFAAGERSVENLVHTATEHLKSQVDRVDYLEIRDAHNLQVINRLEKPAVMLVAAYVGKTRLIDNLRLE
jgi:pantoate--beta-alanine ligase